MSQAVITAVGRMKLCKAHAGDITLPIIAQMAFGDGGLETDGQPKATTGNEAGLYKELLRRNVDKYIFSEGANGETDTTCRYTHLLNKTDLGGKVISEMGLYDSEGDLVAYKTFLGKGKDDDMEFDFFMDEIF